jgi:hypothetical protein
MNKFMEVFMKVTIIKGPHFEQTEKKVYEYLSKVLSKQATGSQIKKTS